MKNISLKYRITFVILTLECLLVYFVLGPVQSKALHETEKQLIIAENAKFEILSDLTRTALITSEYDELQPLMESMSNDPNINSIIVTNANDLVVVSSDVTLVGKNIPTFDNKKQYYWKQDSIQSGSDSLGKLAVNFSRKDMLSIIEQTRNNSWIIALIGLSVITVAALVAGYLLTKRLNILALAAKHIAEGDYETKLNFMGSDELSILGHAIDKMQSNIKQNINELNENRNKLEATKADLEIRVAERTKECALARDKALEASKAKSSFLANMSHELRTPLNIMIGYSELIESDPKNQQDQELIKDIKNIKESGQHLLELVNNVLDISKIDAGKMDLLLEEDNIRLIIEGLVEQIKPEITKSGNTLTTNISLKDNKIYSDSMIIRKILNNILSNANKFTHAGNIDLQISNTIYENENSILFKITDTGIGMSSDKINSLFGDFTQAEDSLTRQYEGTGLGLSISKRYCSLLGGKIMAESSEKTGSIFSVIIPQHYPVNA